MKEIKQERFFANLFAVAFDRSGWQERSNGVSTIKKQSLWPHSWS